MMGEECSRTGDPAKDARPPGKQDLKFRLGCIAALVILAVIIAIFSMRG